MMEGGVDDARSDAVGDQRAQGGFAGAARKPDPVAVAHPALLGVVRMHLQAVFLMPHHIGGATGLGADIVLAEDAPVVKSSGKRGPVRSSVATYSVIMNLPLPRTKPSMCMTGVPSGAFSLQGHCTEPSRSSLSKETPAKVGVNAAISSMISEGWL